MECTAATCVRCIDVLGNSTIMEICRRRDQEVLNGNVEGKIADGGGYA
jgi:hypothetical protein